MNILNEYYLIVKKYIYILQWHSDIMTTSPYLVPTYPKQTVTKLCSGLWGASQCIPIPHVSYNIYFRFVLECLVNTVNKLVFINRY